MLRDKVVDGVLTKNLADSAFARDLVSTIESGIRFSRRLTLLNVLILPKPPRQWKESRKKFLQKQAEDLPHPEADTLSRYRAEYQRIILFHCLFCSVSGLALVISALVIALPIILLVILTQWTLEKLINLTRKYATIIAQPITKLLEPTRKAVEWIGSLHERTAGHIALAYKYQWSTSFSDIHSSDRPFHYARISH